MRANINPKSRNIDFYLEKIKDNFDIEVDRLEVFSTAGDWLPIYPYQWLAKTKIREGEEDCYEGVGGTPFEAVKDLYYEIKLLVKEGKK